MEFEKSGRTAAAIGLSFAALVAAPASAHHSWSTYAWNMDGASIGVPIYDNTTAEWRGHVAEAVDYWNASEVIDAPVMLGNNSSCSFITNTIQVCNADYGSSGWLGLASIALSNGKIIAGSTKLNDHYFADQRYNSYSWRQLVTCQEIGHDYGLAHQDEDFNTDATTSCMEYTSQPSNNEHPDFHDYEQLLIIYAGGTTDGGGGTTDGGGTGGGGKGKGGGSGSGKGGGPKTRVNLPAVGNTPDSWGRPVDYLPNGKPHVFVREAAGMKFVTHVTYAPDEGGEHHH